MIFICYRSQNTPFVPDLLCERFKTKFGSSIPIFYNIDCVEPGQNWRVVVEEAIENSQIVLVLIGEEWHKFFEPESSDTYAPPSDPVQYELSLASTHKKTVVPVFVDQAKMPSEDELPAALSWLWPLDGIRLRPYGDFQNDALRIEEFIIRHCGPIQTPVSASNASDREPASTAPAVPFSVDAVQTYNNSFAESYMPYASRSQTLLNPDRIYVPMRCLPLHDVTDSWAHSMDSVTKPNDELLADALKWAKDGLETGKAQLLLSHYGTGKSHLALRLLSTLTDEYVSSRGEKPIPILFPLQNYSPDPNHPDSILNAIFAFIQAHRFPDLTFDQFSELIAIGKFHLIFDGIDEIRLVQRFNPIDVLAMLDLRRFGRCGWIATSRTGLFSSDLPRLRDERKYRIAYLNGWTSLQWRFYGKCCKDIEGIFSGEGEAKSFLETVDRTPPLRELTKTPLYGRMLVESRSEILGQHHDMHETFQVVDLYKSYANYALSKSSAQSYLPTLDSRRRCMECAALQFFETSRLTASKDELTQRAYLYLRDISNNFLRDFISIEMQTYSLLIADPDTAELSFSHKSFYEYFLAVALLRSVQNHGWVSPQLETALDTGETAFVAQLLEKSGYKNELAALRRTIQRMPATTSTAIRRNVVAIAAACGKSCDLTAADFSGLSLSGLDLSGAKLCEVNLTGASAVGTDFSRADLSRASFLNADLTRANLSGAILTDTDFSYSNLSDIKTVGSDPPVLLGATFDNVTVTPKTKYFLLWAIQRHDTEDQQWVKRAQKELG